MSVVEEQVKQIMIDMDAQRAKFVEEIAALVTRMHVLELEHNSMVERTKGIERRLLGAVIINEEVIGQAIGLELVKQLRHGTARILPPKERMTTVLEKEDF